MAWDSWMGGILTDKEELLKRGYLLTTTVKIDTGRARLALNHSAPRFLAYCAFARFARQNFSLLLQRSFLVVVRFPENWEPTELVTMAKLVLKASPEIVIYNHPKKEKRGHEFDADDVLRYSRIILFAREGMEVHPDALVAATADLPVDICLPRHLLALSRLLGCGELSDPELAALKDVPSERFNAIFRINRSASQALKRLNVPLKEEISLSPDFVIDPFKGFGEASMWARNLRDDLAAWRAGEMGWSEIDKGILIYGPSGTGKTIFATALAKALDLNSVATSVTRWQSARDGHLGDLLKAMYSTFSSATEQAPSLLFLDEFDSIGHRGRFPAKWENYSLQVVNGLLECLDGATGREGVIVIGACNFPEKIDPALLRSGRLEKHVHFPLPDADNRLSIFESYLPHLAGDDRLRRAAERLPGKTGADINQIVRGARRLARKGMRDVTVADIEFLMPETLVLSDEELFRVSAHECGHAIIAGLLDVGVVHAVEVYDYENTYPTEVQAHGLTVVSPPRRQISTRSNLIADIAVLLAGIAAEEILLGDRSNSAGGSQTSDLDRATRLAMEFITKYGLGNSLTASHDAIDRHGMHELWRDQALREEVNRLLQTEFRRVKDLLNGRKRPLLAMTLALKEKKTLSGKELGAFIKPMDDAAHKARSG